jgi:hypothetical protein
VSLDVDELYFDDENLEEMWRHRVTAEEVQQVRDDRPRFFKNEGGGRTATHVMVGRTAGGRLLFVPISKMAPGLWRPTTAYPPTPHQTAQYRRSL